MPSVLSTPLSPTPMSPFPTWNITPEEPPLIHNSKWTPPPFPYLLPYTAPTGQPHAVPRAEPGPHRLIRPKPSWSQPTWGTAVGTARPWLLNRENSIHCCLSDSLLLYFFFSLISLKDKLLPLCGGGELIIWAFTQDEGQGRLRRLFWQTVARVDSWYPSMRL